MPEDDFIKRIQDLAEKAMKDIDEVSCEAGKVYDILNPTWHEVSYKRYAIGLILKTGKIAAKHCHECENPQCEQHTGLDATKWMNPGMFREMIKHITGTLKSRGEDDEDVRQLTAIEDLWRQKPDEDIRNDPRYRATQIGWDGVLLIRASETYTKKVPKW